MTDEKALKRIWLQTGGDYALSAGDCTWSSDKIEDDDQEYIRADLAPQWQPIETAPKDVFDILAWDEDNDDYILVGWSHVEDRWVKTYGKGRPGNLTHWMPLPDPPSPPSKQ